MMMANKEIAFAGLELELSSMISGLTAAQRSCSQLFERIHSAVNRIAASM